MNVEFTVEFLLVIKLFGKLCCGALSYNKYWEKHSKQRVKFEIIPISKLYL